jgi:hypothetical protein
LAESLHGAMRVVFWRQFVKVLLRDENRPAIPTPVTSDNDPDPRTDPSSLLHVAWTSRSVRWILPFTVNR